MRINAVRLVAMMSVMVGPTAAHAQDTAEVEVTPLVAIGSIGASPFGVAVTFPLNSTLSLETRRAEGPPPSGAFLVPDTPQFQLAHMPCRTRHGNARLSVLADDHQLVELLVHLRERA